MNRSTDNKLQEESCCGSCERPDNAESMVACDSCDTWYHFSCAGVDDNVTEQSWQCNSCGTLNASRVTSNAHLQEVGKSSVPKTSLQVPSGRKSSKISDVSKSTTNSRNKKQKSKASVSVASSVKDRAVQLELKMLEEQERVKEQELKEQKEIQQRKLKLEKQMRDRELALEAKKLAEEKAFQEKQLAEEEKFRKAQAEMRQQSMEKKKSS